MKRAFAWIFVLFPLLGAFSCSRGPEINEKAAWGFSTTWQIRLFQGSKQDCENIVGLIERTSDMLTSYETHYKGGVYQLNEDRKVISPELAKALRVVAQIQESTLGYFNPFLLDLNLESKESLSKGAPLPSQRAAELAEIARNTSLSIKGDEISIIGDGNIDLGAIGKGYCLDLVLDYLKEHKITNYFISGGTSSLLLGETGDQQTPMFTVSPRDLPSFSFKAADSGVSTSSISEQGYEIDGKKYSHIVNPFDGSSLAHYDFLIVSKGIAEPNINAFLDAASTAMFNMDKDQIKQFAENVGLRYAVGLDQKIIQTNMETQ